MEGGESTPSSSAAMMRSRNKPYPRITMPTTLHSPLSPTISDLEDKYEMERDQEMVTPPLTHATELEFGMYSAGAGAGAEVGGGGQGSLTRRKPVFYMPFEVYDDSDTDEDGTPLSEEENVDPRWGYTWRDELMSAPMGLPEDGEEAAMGEMIQAAIPQSYIPERSTSLKALQRRRTSLYPTPPRRAVTISETPEPSQDPVSLPFFGNDSSTSTCTLKRRSAIRRKRAMSDTVPIPPFDGDQGKPYLFLAAAVDAKCAQWREQVHSSTPTPPPLDPEHEGSGRWVTNSPSEMESDETHYSSISSSSSGRYSGPVSPRGSIDRSNERHENSLPMITEEIHTDFAPRASRYYDDYLDLELDTEKIQLQQRTNFWQLVAEPNTGKYRRNTLPFATLRSRFHR